jgi:threonine synthase
MQHTHRDSQKRDYESSGVYFLKKINKQEKGIWRYVDFYSEFIEKENRLSLDNQNRNLTPVITGVKFLLKPLLNIKHLYFKREDENPTGSFKDRSLAYQVSLAKQNKKRELVISTSGNAGIAAAAYCQKAGIKLYAFISPETEKEKVIEMQKYDPIIIKSKRAIRFANYLSAKYKIENLRPSVNNSSIEGFKSIAFEIFENLGKVDAIFTFVTSGSSFIGIGRAYKYLWETGEIESLPKLYAIQSGNIFSIAQEFGGINLERKTSGNGGEAGKLGIKNTSRKKEVIELMK